MFFRRICFILILVEGEAANDVAPSLYLHPLHTTISMHKFPALAKSLHHPPLLAAALSSPNENCLWSMCVKEYLCQQHCYVPLWPQEHHCAMPPFSKQGLSHLMPYCHLMHIVTTKNILMTFLLQHYPLAYGQDCIIGFSHATIFINRQPCLYPSMHISKGTQSPQILMPKKCNNRIPLKKEGRL